MTAASLVVRHLSLTSSALTNIRPMHNPVSIFPAPDVGYLAYDRRSMSKSLGFVTPETHFMLYVLDKIMLTATTDRLQNLSCSIEQHFFFLTYISFPIKWAGEGTLQVTQGPRLLEGPQRGRLLQEE